MRAALFAVALLAAGCAARGTRIVLPEHEYPPALDLQVRVVTTSGAEAWCTPISIVQCYTARHVLADNATARWLDLRGDRGDLRAGWRHPVRDIGQYIADSSEFRGYVATSKKLPPIGATVYWRFFLPGHIPTWNHGTYLGLDADGDGHIDGLTHPGGSGAGILTRDGRLIGVMNGGYVPAAYGETPTDVDGWIKWFLRSSAIRPSLIFTPLKAVD